MNEEIKKGFLSAVRVMLLGREDPRLESALHRSYLDLEKGIFHQRWREDHAYQKRRPG